jgi:hypothetical protein
MSKKFSLAPFICIPFLACGSSDSPHHVTTPDSGTGSGSGSGSAAPCTAAAVLPTDFGSAADQLADWDGSGTTAPGTYEEWFGALNSDVDYIKLELYAGHGGVTTGLKPGTYAITGDDTNYISCGVCVRMFTDVTQTSGQTPEYFASSGTVTLTSVGSGSGSGSGSDKLYGTFSGSFQNLSFDHVDIGSDFTSTPVGDCTSTLASGTFSADLTMAAGSAAAPSLKIHWTSAPALRHRHK